MPESPEVQALARFLAARLTGREITAVDVLEFRIVKTRARPLDSVVGQRVADVVRHGKHLAFELNAAELVVSLGRHGWARWIEPGAEGVATSAAPALASIAFDDGGVLEWTDAGSWVSLGVHVVDRASEVPAIAKLGADPASPSFARADFDSVVRGRRKQIKAILQEQESLAGIGNAYSDEILHTARVSPVAHASTLEPASLDRLFDATVTTVRAAIDAQHGVPIDGLKAAKVAAMRVHGRAGSSCPVCGDAVRTFAFASTTAEYCPTCQTDGVVLPA